MKTFASLALISAIALANPTDIGNDISNGVVSGKDAVADVTNLIHDIQTIKTNGLTPEEVSAIKDHLETAISHGLQDVQIGKSIVSDIQSLISHGAQPQNVSSIVTALETSLQGILPHTNNTNTNNIGGDIIDIVNMSIEAKNDITNLVNDMQTLAKTGLTPELSASIMTHVQNAVAHGLRDVKGGATIVQDIQNVIKNGATISDGISIANGIQTALQSILSLFDANPKVCMLQGTGRGVGNVLVNKCHDDEEGYGALCYPKCKDGYENIGCCICRKKGCSGVEGVTDIGVSCTKPKAYGRGAGYAIWDHGKCEKENTQGCEKNGAMWYPKCRASYHAFGCCICTPDCPAGTHDDGAYCRKDSYGRGVGASRLGCTYGLEQSGLLCYPPCPAGQNGVGPMCWPKCSGDTPVQCGLFCTSTIATCASSAVEIAGTATTITLSIVTQDYMGALTQTIKAAGKLITMDKCPKSSISCNHKIAIS
uniref:Secreted protein n=1 Tax=Thraustotheca clavata TaxID=74557 RepID=A0A0A7CLX0_9STRA|nr:secreted protein [Thraustotheca clavata]